MIFLHFLKLSGLFHLSNREVCTQKFTISSLGHQKMRPGKGRPEKHDISTVKVFPDPNPQILHFPSRTAVMGQRTQRAETI
jgi:hypothetical protein